MELPASGEWIAGKYELVRVLGRGGMGVVYEARHRRLDERFAIKFLLPNALGQPDAVARFEREARASARLRSPYAVRVLDVDVDSSRGGLPFMVMEYLEGQDLGTRLRTSGPPPVRLAIDFLLQALFAMAEAHARGIVHRDLKVSNLFVVEGPLGPMIKVMDFGISKLAPAPGERELTTTEMTLGTPSYMAPEQVMSSKTVDHRIDIWALGVVLYRMLTGTFPFLADNPTALAVAIATEPPVPITKHRDDLPPGLADVVMAALTRDLSARIPDAISFARRVEPFGSGRISVSEQLALLTPPSSPSLVPSARDESMAPSSRRSVMDGTSSVWPAIDVPTATSVESGTFTDPHSAMTTKMDSVVVRREQTNEARRGTRLTLAGSVVLAVVLAALGLGVRSRSLTSSERLAPASSLQAPSAVLEPRPSASVAGSLPTVLPSSSPLSEPTMAPVASVPKPSASAQRSAPRLPKSGPPKPSAGTAPSDPLHL